MLKTFVFSAEEQCLGGINWEYSDSEVIGPGPPVFFLLLQEVERITSPGTWVVNRK